MKRIFILLICILNVTVQSWGSMIKTTNVAGGFYSADPRELAASIDQFKSDAGSVPDDREIPIAIAPHAGYVYSGIVAAATFKAIARNHYKTIVIIGPSHYVNFEGISIWPKGFFQTPLGKVRVDEKFAAALLKANTTFQFLPHVFDQEHAIEVELPFLQKTFQDLHIVPILMGNPNPQVCRDLAIALDRLIGNRRDVLVLISSDMSHYFDYDTANRMDALTLGAIKAIDAQKFFEGCLARKMEMCGFMPVTTALILAQLRGLDHVEVLKHANSGDTVGDKSRVVGYAAVIFYRQLLNQVENDADRLNVQQHKELLSIARKVIDSYVRTGKVINIKTQDQRLMARDGAFVTVYKKGELRGCIGSIIGQEPLYQTVRDMAIAAVSTDPRFSPVKVSELSDIKLEISVLSVPRGIKSIDEIQLGKHGVIVIQGDHQGVFLPQVATETHWSKEEFLSQLCSQKAGLLPDAWKDPATAIYIFTAQVFAEN